MSAPQTHKDDADKPAKGKRDPVPLVIMAALIVLMIWLVWYGAGGA